MGSKIGGSFVLKIVTKVANSLAEAVRPVVSAQVKALDSWSESGDPFLKGIGDCLDTGWGVATYAYPSLKKTNPSDFLSSAATHMLGQGLNMVVAGVYHYLDNQPADPNDPLSVLNAVNDAVGKGVYTGLDNIPADAPLLNILTPEEINTFKAGVVNGVLEGVVNPKFPYIYGAFQTIKGIVGNSVNWDEVISKTQDFFNDEERLISLIESALNAYIYACSVASEENEPTKFVEACIGAFLKDKVVQSELSSYFGDLKKRGVDVPNSMASIIVLLRAVSVQLSKYGVVSAELNSAIHYLEDAFPASKKTADDTAPVMIFDQNSFESAWKKAGFNNSIAIEPSDFETFLQSHQSILKKLVEEQPAGIVAQKLMSTMRVLIGNGKLTKVAFLSLDTILAALAEEKKS